MKEFRRLNDWHREQIEQLHWIAGSLARIQSNSKNLGNATSYEDLKQVAYRGICAAVYDWDENGGKSISSYAYDRAFAYIGHYMRDKSRLIKIPRKTQKLYYNYVEIKEKNPDMSDDDIAQELECNILDLISAKRVSTSTPFELFSETLETDMEENTVYVSVDDNSTKMIAMKYIADKLTDKQMEKMFKFINGELKNGKEIREYALILDRIKEDLDKSGVTLNDFFDN